MKKFTIAIMMLIASIGFSNKSFSQDVVDATTLNNKIMAGYQGWFGAPGDGSGHGWIHWGGPTIDADNISFDMWPDMREYDADELFETNFVYKDLTNAGLFSSYTTKTVDRHVKWMKDYGIDGVFVQRFISSALSRRGQRDTVLQNVRYGAEKHGRVFANMYDMSGGKAESFVEDVKTDWMHLVDDLKITESPNYLHHNGLPVLSLWGVKVGGSNGIITATHWKALLQWFTVDAPEKYRVTLKAGVGNGWRTEPQEWQEVYDYFEFISPWAVGRYKDNAGADGYRTQYFQADLDETSSRGMDYMPVVWPGFSWTNLYPDDGGALNKIPRNGGKFFWRQLYNAIDAGCNMVYIAMFDEVDEGTAIFKVAENKDQIPTTGKFVTLDMDGYDLPSDWYLRLAGEATKMLRNEIPLTSTIPITARPNNSGFNSQDVPTIMSPEEVVSVSISMENTGTELWTKMDNYALFSSVSSTTLTWGIAQVELDDNETINPEESKDFNFSITAPATEGVYEFQWRMKKEGEWFGAASDKRYINVTNSSDILDDCDALTDWTSSASLALNTTDNKQGTGCIEFTGGSDKNIEFAKIFATPYNSGISAYDAVLQLWYYISDASAMGANFTVGLGSNGVADENEYTWTISDFSTGWNLLTLNVNDATVKGSPDLNAINWFRVNNPKTGDVTTRIDEIQLFDRYSGKEKYELVVNDGTGSGNYVQDAIVHISANEAPAGSEFTAWEIVAGDALIESPKAMNTDIRMLGGNVEISAVYKMFGVYFDDCDDLDGWGSSAGLTLNTVDQKEGAGCVEFSGDQTDDYKKAFTKPYNSGATHETGSLEFWYYVSDASLLSTNNQIEVGSAGRPDQFEYNWTMNVAELENGWNKLSYRFSEASVMDTPDLSALNWFRIYNFKTGSVVTRIDAIEVTDPNGGERYTLTVRNGEGDGNYFTGTEVNVVADPNAEGKLFDKWIIEEGDPTITDINAIRTTVTIGEQNAIIAATYTDPVKYELVVNNGTGDGSYNPGSSPVITADKAPEGQEFDKWIVNKGTISISNINATLTYFTMPEEDVEVTATFKDVVSISTKEKYALNIYPNPAKSELSVDFTLDESSKVNISILDLSGRAVGETINNPSMDAGNYKLKLPVSDLKQGTYLMSIRVNKNMYTELLMIE